MVDHGREIGLMVRGGWHALFVVARLSFGKGEAAVSSKDGWMLLGLIAHSVYISSVLPDV